MIRTLMASVLAALSVGAAAFAADIPANIAAGLADKGRPAKEVERDAARRPGELLAFAGVKPGDKVADFIIGGGYFTRILSVAVGPTGHVTAYQPAEFIQYAATYGDSIKAVAAAYPNVTADISGFGAFNLPDGLDLVLTVQNYHDLHLKPFPAGAASAIDKEVYASLKPGGVFLVVDHAALPNTGFTTSDTLHRIDKAALVAEIEAVGFKLDAESPLLANPADPHTASVFDPAIQGRTDQFVLKFRKPK